MNENYFPFDLDEILMEAERQGFVFNNGKWGQSGYRSKSTKEMYDYIKNI